MKKLFKTLLITFMTVCAVCMCAFALTACSGNNNPTDSGSSDGDTDIVTAAYIFEIKNSDGTPYTTENAKTQICLPESAGGTCIPLFTQNIYPENGKLEFTQEQINTFFKSETDVTEFLFHVIPATGEGYGDSENNSHCVFQISGADTYTCIMYTK